MSNPTAFTGSIPEIYHRCLGPLLFEPYAKDLAARLRAVKLPPNPRILELACGTGIVTRELLSSLPSAHITATDLNEAMLDIARKQLGPAAADPRLRFQQADACKLPFPDRSFDVIVCQYGMMFFSDKPGAMPRSPPRSRPRRPLPLQRLGFTRAQPHPRPHPAGP